MANVVIVGGSEETRLLLRGLLRLYRHRVVGDGPGPETIDRAMETGGPTTVIMEVDLNEPAEVDELRRAVQRYPLLRFIVLTARHEAATAERAQELGVAGFLRRPFAVHELVDALEGAQTVDPTTGVPPRHR
jgi:DNA-binding NarL/FixJ family response regulator